MMSLFNKAIQHTGDNDGTTDVDTVLGDSENIIFDLRAVPAECNQILFGALLVTPPTNPSESRPYIHMLPMMRPETIEAQKAAGGTREIQYEDSDDDSDSESDTNSPQAYGTRGIGDETGDESDDNRHDFVTLFYAELNQYPNMMDQKGFVGGKLFRSGAEWMFTPYRTVVAIDPQYGLWPALDYYGKYTQQQPQQPQQQPQQQYYSNNNAYAQPNPYQSQQYSQPPPQQYGFDPYQSQQQYGAPQAGYQSYPPQQPYYPPQYN